MGRSGRPRIQYVELHLSAVKIDLMGRQRPASFPRTVWASFFPLPPPLDPGLKDGAREPYLKVEVSALQAPSTAARKVQNVTK